MLSALCLCPVMRLALIRKACLVLPRHDPPVAHLLDCMVATLVLILDMPSLKQGWCCEIDVLTMWIHVSGVLGLRSSVSLPGAIPLLQCDLQHPFSPAPPSSATCPRDFTNQADVPGLAKFVTASLRCRA
eukprot:1155536-Pelagomonas_calceolata.AAC.3